MEHVWDTMLKINSTVDKFQQAYTALCTDNCMSLVDVEKRMKALEKFRREDQKPVLLHNWILDSIEMAKCDGTEKAVEAMG